MGGLALHDTLGVPAKTVSLTEYGLVGEIHKSKTSGAGKKLGLVKFYVSTDAWLSERTWLRTGWQV